MVIHIKYKALILYSLLIGSCVNCMEIPIVKNDVSTKHQVQEIASLKYIAAQSIVKKLKYDMLQAAHGKSTRSFEKYLASCPLTKDCQEIILRILAKEDPQNIWQILPYDVVQQNIGLESVRDIIPFENNQLLILYDEEFEANKSSKIKIWDVSLNDWSDKTIELPKVFIRDWAISKDLKTLFLWCRGYYILICDLENNSEISRITSSSAHIKSFSLFNNDQYICCGLENGKVAVFDRQTTKEVASFEVSNLSIDFIDSLGDMIVTCDSFHIDCWRLDMDDLKYDKIGGMFLNKFNVHDFKLGFNGNRIMVDFGLPALFTYPSLRPIEHYTFNNFVGFKRSLNGKLFLIADGRQGWFGMNRKEFNILMLLNSKTGQIVGNLDLTKLLATKAETKWKGFAISPNNDFLIFYSDKGQIAKIKLNFDKDLVAIFRKMVSNAQGPWCTIC